MSRMRRDLAAVVAFACLALVVAILPAPVWLRSSALIPLVLVLPGYVLASIFFPPRSVSPAERGVYAVTLSIAVAALAGLVVQVAIGLDRAVWTVLLGGLTIGLGVRGLSTQPREAEPLRLARPWGLPLAVAAFLTAGIVAGLSIASAGDGLHKAQAKLDFTEFWMLPGASPNRVAIGVRSHESHPAHYRLVLEREGRSVARIPLRLPANGSWEESFALPSGASGGRVFAELRREGRVYRKLDLEMPG